jgi:UDP-3-O-[3-hydroxymyristoyl] glucosamine N-acyltransferase
MLFSDLTKFYPQLEIIYGNPHEFMGISSSETPKESFIVLIKNRRFLNELSSFFGQKDYSKSYLFIDKKLQIEISQKDEWTTLCKQFQAVVSVEDINLCLSFISKPFYEKKLASRNNFVDGRQMSTAEIHPTAMIAQGVFIAENVVIQKNVKIYPGCTILSGVTIGEGTILYPNVTIYDDVQIGNNCRIHAGAVIGADGFGYNFSKGEHVKVWHTGSVIIGDNVEIGANTTIDQGTFEPTRIGSGTKIDNLVQVGHNSKVGRGVILCGQVGLAGSCELGDFNVLGGKAGVGPDVKLGKAVQVAGSAMVAGDWPDGAQVAGHPARPVKEWMKGLAYVRKKSLE